MADVVTWFLKNLVQKQVDDHRLVVWYDPERVYAAASERLDLPDTTIARYAGSFFALRREIDGLLTDLQPPRLVVYVPEDRAATHNALIELEAAGVVIQPGQQPPNRNTRLAVVAATPSGQPWATTSPRTSKGRSRPESFPSPTSTPSPRRARTSPRAP
jgi:hypothetical protein